MRVDYTSILFMFILIILGFILVKIKLLNEINLNTFPVILLNISYPALIINSITSVDVRSLVKEGIIVIVVTLVMTLMLFFIGIKILKKYNNTGRKPLILFSLVIGNTAYVALPVIYAFFGDVGVYFMTLHNFVQDILIWTIYYAYFVGNGHFKSITIKKLISPTLISLILAVTLAIFKIRPSGLFANVLQSLANLTVPLALIYIGGVLAGYSNLKDWSPDRDTIILSISKVLVLPLIVFGIMQFIPVSNELKLLMAVIFSAPMPLLGIIWAKQYNYDYVFSIKALLFSTVLFLIATGVLFTFVDVGVL